ncbi:MAG: hypothetical protein VW835_08550 [Rickettsiales bacterium]
MSDGSAFTVIHGAGRIWAVGSIHGEAGRLRELHDRLETRLRTNDRLVYLGNYLGYGPEIIATVDELLAFRRRFLARPPFTDANDLIFLRGSQEEMWQRVLQLQFAVDPVAVMVWMGERGLAATLAAYAGDAQQDLLGQRAGPLTIAQWTGSVRSAMAGNAGHVAFMSALKRAAYTADEKLLFVNAGLDTGRSVENQSDSFWWAGRSFTNISAPYASFAKIVRGFDPDHGGYSETAYTLTIDGGCGFDGPLLAVCLSPEGEVEERLEA